MAGTWLCALVIVATSLAVGRALMLALGWRRHEWVAGAAGFAALVVVAPFAVRLPGRGLTAAILLGLAALGCVAYVARRAGGPGRGGGRLMALTLTAAMLAAASLPFAFNEATGVLGEGIYTNDQAAQLYWADWLADGFGPQPNAVSVGYPVGPQALAATVSEGTGVNLVGAFNGLLLAIPALTALAALSALAAFGGWRRGLAAGLAGLPYLGASFLAQSGFKETAMALLVLALGVVLHLASGRGREAGDEPGSGSEPPPARAVVGVVAVLAAASVFTFSIPGGVWFGLAIPAWAALMWFSGQARAAPERIRADWRRHRRLVVGGGAALLALAVVALGPAGAFIDRIGDVQESSGRLSSPVFPGEALGIWLEGDFRIVRGDVPGSLLATAFAALCAAGAALALIRRREWALLATLGSAAAVYAVSRPLAEIHVEAKALAVLAPIAMLVTVRWLLAPARDGAGALRLGVGAGFAVLALASTFLALRAAPVGFGDRGEDLHELAQRIDGDSVAFLGIDRFAAYYLRGTLVESPGGYVPPDVKARPQKTWQQGLALDFDTLSPAKLDNYRYAITTTTAYASTPPKSFSEVARAGDYVLWERSGKTPPARVLAEGGEPGMTLACPDQAIETDRATVLTEPVRIEQEDWKPGFFAEAPASFSAAAALPSGRWSASIQYHSQVPLSLRADGEEIARLPPSLEGLYLTGAGRGAFWPAGELTASEPETAVEVVAAEPSAFQRALGVTRKVWVGTLAFTALTKPRRVSAAEACGAYVDHYLPERG